MFSGTIDGQPLELGDPETVWADHARHFQLQPEVCDRSLTPKNCHRPSSRFARAGCKPGGFLPIAMTDPAKRERAALDVLARSRRGGRPPPPTPPAARVPAGGKSPERVTGIGED